METWLGVELRHLSVLAAVAQERSFRGAADRLGYVQSAVSQRISQLERLVGVRLVERTRGYTGVELTEAGDLLLHHAEQISAQMNAAQADLRSLTDAAGASCLRLGVFGSLATRLLPQTLSRLAKQCPDLRVETREALSDGDLFAGVKDGELDAAFAELPLEAGEFDWQELLVDPLVLLVPAGSPLAQNAAPPGLAEIAQQPVVFDRTWRTFPLIEARFAAAGHQLDTPLSASSNAGIQALVGAGLGVAIVPRLAVDLDDSTTEVVQLHGILPARTLVCYWQRGRRTGPALDALSEATQAVCAGLSRADSHDDSVMLAA